MLLNFSTLTAPQKAKYLVLVKLNQWRKTELPELSDGAAIDALYASEEANDDGRFQDSRNESRWGIEASSLNRHAPVSRHYDIDAHCAELPDGVWVGWWHLSGGGKHSEPDGYDWVSNAFDVDHVAEVVTVTKHTFTKREPAPSV